MELIILPLVIVIAFGAPLLSAYYAHTLGRSFWKWFLIGCIFPFTTNFVLACLPVKSKSNSLLKNRT